MLRIGTARCRSSSLRVFPQSHNVARWSNNHHNIRSISTRLDRVPVAYSGSSRRKALHRLFLAGINPFLPSHLQSSVSPVFTEVPLDEWISSISGRNAGVSKRPSMHGAGIRKADIEVTHVASGLGHVMIGFRDRRTEEEKIFAIGRNESGQLGLGYNSQVGGMSVIGEKIEGAEVYYMRRNLPEVLLKVSKVII